MTTLHQCPVCNVTQRKPLLTTRDRHYHVLGEWTIASCKNCGMIQLDPMPTTDELVALYPKDFYAFNDLAKKNSGWFADLKRLLFPSMYVNDPTFLRAGRVLDSGCGTGWALIPFKNKGWECIGIDPSNSATAFGITNYQLDVRAGTVLSAKLPSAHFDYVRSNHSLEHDPVINDTIAEFRRIIKDDGKLLIGVPNINSPIARFFGKYWWNLNLPFHVNHFSKTHIEQILKKNNFKIDCIRYTGNCGGIVGSLQLFMNRKNENLGAYDGLLINSKFMLVVGQILSIPFNLFKVGDCFEFTCSPIKIYAE